MKEKTFFVYDETIDAEIPLQQEDILNHINADLDEMMDGDDYTITIRRRDLTQEEIDNLVVV